jgi:hypothetical protein
MAKKKTAVNEEVIADAVVETAEVEQTSVITPAAPYEYVKPKLSAAQIKELLKDYSKVTLKARGII